MRRKGFPLPATPGRGTIETGWVRDLDAKLLQAQGEASSLEARLKMGLGFGTPGAWQGERLFTPERNSFLLNENGRSGYPSSPVNYVVRDGQAYDVLIRIPGPGVFEAHGVHVAIYKRIYRPGLPEPMWVNAIPLMTTWERNLVGANIKTICTRKVGLWPWYWINPSPPFPSTITPNFYNEANYVWNLFDPRSARKLSDDWLNQLLLLPRLEEVRGFNNPEVPNVTTSFVWRGDGGLFTFPCPWLFQRDSEVLFQWRPITPILQYDSSVDLTALPAPDTWAWDDRQNGVRDQTIKVVATLWGMRLETDQDQEDIGALTRG